MQKTIDYWIEESAEAIEVAGHLFKRRIIPMPCFSVILLSKKCSRRFM